MKTKIFLIDQGLGAEFIAAIQSYYSRDPGSAYSHVQKGLREDPKEFLKKYYKQGYAHKSIAQCATVTIFIENVSILFPKALQDSPYYNGQEASTRYIDFSKLGFANPFTSPDIQFCTSDIVEDAKKDVFEELLQWLNIDHEVPVTIDTSGSDTMEQIHQGWMSFYTDNFKTVSQFLRELNPIKAEQDVAKYENAIYSRTCDILRGFLPAGMKTLLSWHTTLDHANDVLKVLKYHPATEIRAVARGILKALINRYPETFVEEFSAEIEGHLELVAKTVSYYEPEVWAIKPGEVKFDLKSFSKDELEPFKEIIQKRPRKGLAHRILGRAGNVGIKYLQDYGSIRDILRHRPGVNQVPVLTTEYGFEEWYVDSLPESLQENAWELIRKQQSLTDALTDISLYDRQYVIPLGFRAPMYHNWPFNQLLYVPELRTGSTVHPTVQKTMRGIALWVKEEFADIIGTAYYPSIGDGKFSYHRGSQTISV